MHNRSVATPCQTMSCQTRDSRGKPKTTTVSLPGPTEHASAIQDSRFRRAGCGVFFSINDNRNCSFTLPGREQTNNRAESLALIAAMKIHDGNLEIRSDSEYVVRIATSRVRGETQKCNEENADLWNEFETVLKINDTRRLEFVWVKGHATKATHRPAGNHHSEQGR